MLNLVGKPYSKYPNEIGRVQVSLEPMSIVPIEIQEELVGETMARSKKSKKDDSAKAEVASNGISLEQDADKKAVDAIWKHLGLGHIDISYACIGYSMDGRPILNHDELVSLLVNYGFNIQDVLPFIDDFASHSAEDNKSPIVMYTANTSAIMTSIEPIV